MAVKEGIIFFLFFIVLSSRNGPVVSGKIVIPRFPSVNSGETLHSMKKIKKDIQEMELCIGRKCAKRRPNDHSNKAGIFVGLTIVSLVVIFAVLTRQKPEKSCPQRHGSVLHSTAVKCDCSSLSPSPMPSPVMKSSPRPVRPVSNYFEDNLVWFDDFHDVSPLPTTPPKYEGVYSDSSSSSDNFPIVPPRRWRGNSKLNLAQSPEVLPKQRLIPSFQLNNVSI